MTGGREPLPSVPLFDTGKYRISRLFDERWELVLPTTLRVDLKKKFDQGLFAIFRWDCDQEPYGLVRPVLVEEERGEKVAQIHAVHPMAIGLDPDEALEVICWFLSESYRNVRVSEQDSRHLQIWGLDERSLRRRHEELTGKLSPRLLLPGPDPRIVSGPSGVDPPWTWPKASFLEFLATSSSSV